MAIKIEHTSVAPAPDRGVAQAMMRGAGQKCPSCGSGRLYSKYLKVVDHCTRCSEAMHHQRADDAPPYFTMFIVGHIVVGGVLMFEQALRPSPWLQLAIWLPLTLLLSLVLLPRIKGALIGLQWALRMHGFDNQHDGNAHSRVDGIARPSMPQSNPPGT